MLEKRKDVLELKHSPDLGTTINRDEQIQEVCAGALSAWISLFKKKIPNQYHCLDFSKNI